MERRNGYRVLASVIVVAVALGLGLRANAREQEEQQLKHEPVTQELINLVEHNAELKQLLVDSIASAKEKNSERQTNPAQTLDEYYLFIDWAAKAMPWSILPDPPARYSTLYDQIDQSLDYFYFINDQPLRALENKGYYNNSLQYHEPYRSWLIDFVKGWGSFLGTGGSWNEAFYKKAEADESFGLKKGWYEDPSNWKTFNQFFARYLKSPSQRPIAAPKDPLVVVSPADARPQGVWKIDKDSNIEPAVGIKSNNFKSVAVLIGKGSAYKDKFANGILTHTFLDVNDYHRYHFPIAGMVKEVRIIPADDAVGGKISWVVDKRLGRKYRLDATAPGWQNIETRGCVIVETDSYGLVAILPIGMSQVSSVTFEESVEPGKRFKKGDMLGSFYFGGSDIVLLFQDKVDFQLTVPKESDRKQYKHVLMGEPYGQIGLKK